MNVSSKLTLYDFLTMMVTGFLLLVPVRSLFLVKELDAMCSIMFFIACYAIGMLYYKVVEWVYEKLEVTNLKCSIQKAFDKFHSLYEKNPAHSSDKVEYFNAYYFLMKRNCLNNIPILEAQEAFTRALWPLAIIYFAFGLLDCFEVLNLFNSSCLVVIISALLFVTLPVVRCKVQLKICYLVWEGYGFLIEQEK